MQCKVRPIIDYLTNYINGTFQHGKGKAIDVISPIDSMKISKLFLSNQDDLNDAVISSLEGFKIWSTSTPDMRFKVLTTAAKNIRENLKEISLMESISTGKTIRETTEDVTSVSDTLEYFGSLCLDTKGTYQKITETSHLITVREPLGVCSGIGAWNFPLVNLCWKVGPALACGNSFIYKPSHLTPATSCLFADFLFHSGLPPGVLNIVQGNGDIGKLICLHPSISKVSFTGSVKTGIQVSKACSDTLKRVTLELGGKSPLIVFDDADLVESVKGAIIANYTIQGQSCSNATRVFIHRNIYESFKRTLLEKLSHTKIGNPLDPETDFGSLISDEHFHKVKMMIDNSVSQGAHLLCGGERVHFPGQNISNGYYMSPCVIENVSDDMDIMVDEVFGPVMCITPFDSEDEVLKRANNTQYGLASGVYTQNISRALRVTKKINSGVCYVNTYNVCPVQMPFGGKKMSGIGHENGSSSLNYYSDLKSIFVEEQTTPSFLK